MSDIPEFYICLSIYIRGYCHICIRRQWTSGILRSHRSSYRVRRGATRRGWTCGVQERDSRSRNVNFVSRGKQKNLRKSFKITHIYRRFPNQWIRRKIRNHFQQFQQIIGTDLKSQLNILIEWKVDAWWKNECWCFFWRNQWEIDSTWYHLWRTCSKNTISTNNLG